MVAFAASILTAPRSRRPGTAPAITGSFAATGFAPRALTVARVIDLGGVNWEWNEHRNKLIPDDAVDNEGGGAPSVMQAGVDLTHVWVREAGSGLAVVDSGEDLAGAVVYLGGVQKTLTLRRAGRFVANLTSSEVDGLQEESAAKDDPVAEEGKGDGDERVTRGTDCVYDVQISQDTIPATGGTVTIEFQKRTWLGGCLGDSVNWKFFGDNVSWITHNRDYFVSGTAFRTVFDVAAYEGVAEPRTGEVWVIDHHNDDAAVGRTTITQARVQHAPTIKLSCDRCDDVTPGSAPVDLITVASDGNGDDDIRPNWGASAINCCYPALISF